MITCIIGHRGVGKTVLANRLKMHLAAVKDIDFVDLDDAIENRAGKKIFEIFIDNGEKYFRDIELQMFSELFQTSNKNLWIILGAGFDVTKIPGGVDVLWVRRETDIDGRIFLDRPRLEEHMRPIDEYLKRFSDRDVNFRKKATFTYLMPEGEINFKKKAFAVERECFSSESVPVPATLTLMPDMFLGEKWPLVAGHLKGKFQSFELRDDLLTEAEMKMAVEELSSEQFIYSYRKETSQILKDFEAEFYDWALELGPPSSEFLSKNLNQRIISSHDSETPLIFESYKGLANHWKWSPEVRNWQSLKFGDSWLKDDLQNRSFLPRSSSGRWRWYRLLQIGKMKINFVRQNDGSAKDQPSLFEVRMMPLKFDSFAAVLGDPVYHSWTPVEHSDFFSRREIPIFAINVSEPESSIAFSILQSWGLKYAAVTSPLKNAAAVWARSDAGAVNSLFIQGSKISATSTDAIGFRNLVEGIEELGPVSQSVVVWGGGGTLESVEKILPNAIYYSSRTGRPRDGGPECEPPKAVIWAAPRLLETKMPPSHWAPVIVYDLNYKEDSMGREYAQISRGKYESGEIMFKGQAQAQRLFWEECEGK